MSKPFNLWDRLRGTLAAVGQKFSDEQFEANLDAAIRAANEQIAKAREESLVARANKISAAKKAEDAKSRQRELEGKAVDLLRSNKKSQAAALTKDIAASASERQKWKAEEKKATEDEAGYLLAMDLLDGQLRRLKYQLSVRRASTNLQRTQEALQRTGRPPQGDSWDPPENKGASKETPEEILARLTRIADKPAKTKPNNTKPDNAKGGKKK